MPKLHKINFFILLSAFIPSVSFALNLSATNTSKFNDIVVEALSIINILTPILFALAFILFFWGLSKFILNSNKPDEIKNGKNYMMWGILALFVLVSFQAIISFVSINLGISTPVVDVSNLLKTNAPTP